MIMKKKKFIYTTVILSGLLMVFSCSQDAIFFKISQETAPVKPRIPGSPTNMVEFTRNGIRTMYVASGNNLHCYNNGIWDWGPGWIPPPGGWITGLAATNDYLYALCLIGTGNGTVLLRIKKDANSWEIVGNSSVYTLIKTIYADSDSTRLFAGAMINSATVEEYGILYTNANTLHLLKGNTGLLSGAASDATHHYLSTNTNGVYTISETDLLSDPTKVNLLGGGLSFAGMIKLDDPSESIIVVERLGGVFYKVDSSQIKPISAVIGKIATGALALWQNTSGSKMLTAGTLGSFTTSTPNGYVEFNLDSTGLPFGYPNDPPFITVDGFSDRYTATIGKYPIIHMHQASDGIFFASTQNQGLWSYRYRSGGPQWNAEN